MKRLGQNIGPGICQFPLEVPAGLTHSQMIGRCEFEKVHPMILDGTFSLGGRPGFIHYGVVGLDRPIRSVTVIESVIELLTQDDLRLLTGIEFFAFWHKNFTIRKQHRVAHLGQAVDEKIMVVDRDPGTPRLWTRLLGTEVGHGWTIPVTPIDQNDPRVHLPTPDMGGVWF